MLCKKGIKMEVIDKIINVFKAKINQIGILTKYFMKISDKKRWKNKINLLGKWEKRARLTSKRIQPNEKVLDLGCGNMELESHLPKGCYYYPSDIVKRDSRTFICDYNKDPIPSCPDSNVTTILGVLEYIYRPKIFIDNVCRKSNKIIISYHIKKNNVGNYKISGWTLIEKEELVNQFYNNNYYLKKNITIEENQELFLFEKAK